MITADVSIVVAPRERFTSVVESLESLFSTVPDHVPVYVAEGASPVEVRQQLERINARRPFTHIAVDYFLTPQEARNLGFERVNTEYVVFTDNDIHYEEGWLDALLTNARDNQSDLVGPLICIGPPKAQTVHHAGGRLVIHMDDIGLPHVTEQHQLMDKPVTEVQEAGLPVENDIVEFHCFLGRSEYIRRIGPLDERLISREQIDFGLRAKFFNAKVTFEQSAVVTYMATGKYQEIDLPYMAFRWCDRLALQSLDVFKGTWGIDTNSTITLNKWIRPHRARAFATFYEDEAKEHGREFFAKVVTPKERQMNQKAFSTRKQVPPRIPAPLEKHEVAAFFNKYKDDPKINVAWVPPFLHRSRPLIVAGMATMPSRRETFFQALESILPQVDRLYLFLDRFKSPLQIQHEKIVPLYSQQFGDLRANGKLLGLTMCGIGPDYFTVDDDIEYPADYVERMVEKLREHKGGAALALHGNRLLREGFDRYSNSRRIVHRSQGITEDVFVDVLGTDTTAFSTRALSFDVRKWKLVNMVDLMFSYVCEQSQVARFSVARPENWVQCLEENQMDSIYRSLKRDDSTQTKLARSLLSMIVTREQNRSAQSSVRNRSPELDLR